MDPEGALAVERRLVSLARSRGPLRAALAYVAVHAQVKRIWERLGYARIGDYATECLGISGRELQDLGKTGARLHGLPAVEAALRSGALSWSKARSVARVATPDDEAAWVAFAQRLTSSALEKETRRVDVDSLDGGPALPEPVEIDEDGPGRGLTIPCTRRVSAKWWRVKQLARQVEGRPLSPRDCAELVAAEVLSAIALEEDEAGEACDDAGMSRERARAQTRARAEDEPAEICEEPVAFDLPCISLEGIGDAGVRELHRRLLDLVRREQRLDAEIGALLTVVVDRRMHTALGFATQERYAKERLGISGRKGRSLIRIERATRRCPALATAYREGALSSVQAEALVPLVLLDVNGRWSDPWVRHARAVTVRRLRDDVEAAVVLADADPPCFWRTGGLPDDDGEPVVSPEADLRRICTADSAPDETCLVWFHGPRDLIQLLRATLCTVRRRQERLTGSLPTEGQALEAMLDHVLEAWGADLPVARLHRVFERDGWHCLVPGCSSRRNLHAHHVVPRSAGGGNEIANLATLCAWHHLRGVHAGLVECRGQAPDGLRFVLPLASYRSGDRRVASA